MSWQSNNLKLDSIKKWEKEIEEMFNWDSFTFENAEEIYLDEYGENEIASFYLGSVLNLAPSGKYYTFWTTNQTEEDVEEDQRFYEALDSIANKYKGWIENGEGDPCDLYFCISRPAEY